MKIRRVATDHDAKGRAIVSADETCSGVSGRPGHERCDLWKSPDGTVFRFVEYQRGVAPRNHRTETVDYAVVISGARSLSDQVSVDYTNGGHHPARTTDLHVLAFNDLHGTLEPAGNNIYGKFAGGAAYLAKAVKDRQAQYGGHQATVFAGDNIRVTARVRQRSEATRTLVLGITILGPGELEVITGEARVHVLPDHDADGVVGRRVLERAARRLDQLAVERVPLLGAVEDDVPDRSAVLDFDKCHKTRVCRFRILHRR